MTYDIGIPEILCTEKLVDDQGISVLYRAKAAHPILVCPNPQCSHDHRPHKHSVQRNLLRDIKSEGMLVVIDLAIQRYRCPDCGIIVRDQFTFFEKRSHITNRLKSEFVRRRLNGETFSYIARDYGVDHKTVAAAYKEYANKHKNELSYSYTPEVPGIDETQTGFET